MLKPFQILEKELNQIEDLTSDLLYEKARFLKVELPTKVVQQLTEVLDYSFKDVNNYIHRMQKHLKYLSYINFNKEKYCDETITKYDEFLLSIQSDLKDVLHSSLYKSGLLIVDLSPFKATMKEAIRSNKVRVMRGIEKQVIEENNIMMK